MTDNLSPAPSVPGETGLRYVARVTASMSHEMKNVLAIINENCGLLEDLSFAAKKGAPIEPDRLDRTCRQMAKQIERADAILKTMSRYAHSFDHPEEPVDLHDLCQLVATLAGRLAAMRRVTLAVEKTEAHCMVHKHPFALQALLWQCLELAIGTASEGCTLTLTPQAAAVTIAGFDRIEGLNGGAASLPITITGEGTSPNLTLHLA